MNHQYRVIWNATTQSLQAVAETAKAHGKGHSSVSSTGGASTHPKLKAAVLAIASAWLGLAPAAWAGPQGGVVTAGSASISTSGTATTINQSSNKAAIDWTSFSVGKSESVRFNQPSSSSVTLNRVTGTESSQILGSLSANGQVFILNPNGMLVGNGAQINTGGFVGSTLGMSNSDFMAGHYQLTAAPGMAANASISNAGNIRVADGASIVLIAPRVSNTGTLSAPNGSVLLAAANQVTLTLQDNQRLSYTLEQGSLQAMVDNGGLIQAAGGHVILTAKGRDALSKATVNHSGIIEAQTMQNNAGVVELLADMQGGQVNLSGRIDASAPNGGNGGFVETSAASVKVANGAVVDRRAALGLAGTWLIDPADFTIGSGKTGTVTGGTPSGDISGATLSTALGMGDVQIQSSQGSNTSGNGDIFVNDAVTWSANQLTLTAQRNININANLNGSGIAKLALEYGQSAGAANNTADYQINNGARVTLSAGQNFSTKLGNDSTAVNYTVITSVGVAGDTTTSTLQGMKNGLSGNYVLGADVDAGATASWNSGAGFAPVGDSGSSFSGRFAGLGHTISGLTINRSTTDSVGLFGTARSSARIRDVGLVGGAVTGGSYVGGLVGHNEGTISNSYSTGAVTGSSSRVGGLVGSNRSGTISNSYSTGAVTGSSGVGGLVGFNNGNRGIGTISNSYSTGAVTGTGTGSFEVGGLVGSNNVNGTISNSYSTGAVTGSSRVGGLVGDNTRGGNIGGVILISGAISNSYSTGAVTGNTDVGGLVGFNAGTITNSYWDTTTSGLTTSSGSLASSDLTTAALAATLPTGFDATVWGNGGGKTTPYLLSSAAFGTTSGHVLLGSDTTTMGSYYEVC